MIALALGLGGWVIGGPGLGLVAGLGPLLYRLRPVRPATAPVRAIMLVMLVELKSGASVLAALRQAAHSFDEDLDLALLSRLAHVSGLREAVEHAPERLSPLLTSLARSQATGSPLSTTLRSLLEADIAEERMRRLARARTLPVRLMIPISLLLLPGLLLMIYAPGLITLIDEIGGPLT